MANWRRSLAAVLIGGVSASICTIIWGILLLFTGVETIQIRLQEAIISGMLTGMLSDLRKLNELKSILISIFLGSFIFLAFNDFSPWNINLAKNSLSAGLGTLWVIISTVWSTRKALSGIELESFDRDEIERFTIRIFQGIGLLFFIIIVAFPFVYMVITSLKSQMALLTNPTDLRISFESGLGSLMNSYQEVWTTFNFQRYIWISTVVSVGTVGITLSLSILGAYSVTRLRFPGRIWLSRSILIIYMFPAIVLVIPLYSIFNQLQLRNNLIGLFIVYTATTLPVALYMLKGFFSTLPAELEEAGRIDGCSRVGVIWRITLPLSLPAISSVALYVFMIAWNEFLFAFMFLDDPNIFTLSRGMVSLNSSEVPRQYLMAGAVMVTVPVMAIFFWFEKYLVSGLASGAVKG
uniref:ABC-type sugar transport system, permease component n=1 Tax=uncultured delta proteobacterium HF0130_20J24 TaxID=710829 RepID=E0XXS4_9DELT|nr:ABC-type sugar transport system, permease component [uncultured delta proteobacterium HF0130_20J24]